MFRCNVCGAIFDKPMEQRREVEYYSRPFGNESEPYGGGYYNCCPECESEDFDRYDEQEHFEDLEKQLSLTKKALELACESIKNMCFESDDVEKPNIEVKWVEYFKNMAKEMMKSE